MMWMRQSRKKVDKEFIRDVNRGYLRSAFKSLFWAVISAKKKSGEFTLTDLAREMGTSKSVVSRWFSGDPNWRINTVADLADALGLEIEIQAIDRTSGRVFSPSGEITERKEAMTQPQRVVFFADEPANSTSSPFVGVNFGS